MSSSYGAGGQTSVRDALRERIAGMLADSGMKDARTFVSEEASAGIPFGGMVARGAGSDGAELPATDNVELLGVVLHSHAYDPLREIDADGNIGPKSELSVLRKGRVAVYCENTCAPGDKLTVRTDLPVSVTVEKIGTFRKGEVADQTTEDLDGIEIVEGQTGAGIIVIEVDMAVVTATPPTQKT